MLVGVVVGGWFGGGGGRAWAWEGGREGTDGHTAQLTYPHIYLYKYTYISIYLYHKLSPRASK